MPRILSNTGKPTVKKACSISLIALFLMMLSALPAWGDDKTKDEETFHNATTALQAMLQDKNVPASLLKKANCVVVLPGVKKFGFGIGGSSGRGPMSCRTSTGWSAPAMYGIGGMSAGAQVGGSSTDFVLLVMTKKGEDALLNGTTKMGHDATAAAGPAGATAAGTSGEDILSYARSKGGLFAGASLGGASVSPDDDANKTLYGKEITAKEILQGGVQTPASGQSFVSLLEQKTATGK